MTPVADSNVDSMITPLLAGRKISCVVPDDGTDRLLIESLRREKGIQNTTSRSCRGIAILRSSVAKRGQLPESELVRKVDVIVPDTDVYEMFEYIHELAGIGKPGGGVMWLGTAVTTSRYTLPENVPEEAVAE